MTLGFHYFSEQNSSEPKTVEQSKRWGKNTWFKKPSTKTHAKKLKGEAKTGTWSNIPKIIIFASFQRIQLLGRFFLQKNRRIALLWLSEMPGTWHPGKKQKTTQEFHFEE